MVYLKNAIAVLKCNNKKSWNKLKNKIGLLEASWEDVQLEDPLSMEVGYRLIPMVDNRQNGELLGAN